jgi:hypothetical protein
MKKTKQNKIKPEDTKQFHSASQASALEVARRVSDKLKCSFAQITELDQAANHAVSVYVRKESLNKRNSWGNDDRKLSVEVSEVLINPAKVPAYEKAKVALELVQETWNKAKAVSPNLFNAWYDSLYALVHDSYAVSTVYRSFVDEDDAGNAVNLTAVSYRRNDRIGELNAVKFGSEKGVKRLLVYPLMNCVPHKRYHNGVKWAGVEDRWTDVNIERIVESAVEVCEPYNCVSVETVDDLYKHLGDSQIWENAREAQDLDARKARVQKLADEIQALGLVLVKGPSFYDGNKHRYTAGVVKCDKVPHMDKLTAYELLEREQSLKDLHQALIK